MKNNRDCDSFIPFNLMSPCHPSTTISTTPLCDTPAACVGVGQDFRVCAYFVFLSCVCPVCLRVFAGPYVIAVLIRFSRWLSKDHWLGNPEKSCPQLVWFSLADCTISFLRSITGRCWFRALETASVDLCESPLVILCGNMFFNVCIFLRLVTGLSDFACFILSTWID